MALNNHIIHFPEEFGCQRACHRWIYDFERRNYEDQTITNIMGREYDKWHSTLWFKFLAPTVEVMEE